MKRTRSPAGLVALLAVCLVTGCGAPRARREPPAVDPASLEDAPRSAASAKPADLVSRAFRAALDVQIQPVRDRKTLDLIRSGELATDFASDWLNGLVKKDQKLKDGAFHFVVVVKNVGTSPAPATETKLAWKRNGALTEKELAERPLAPGAVAFHCESVPCPDAENTLVVTVTTDARGRSPGSSLTRSLEVQAHR